jgi:thioredoxin reductase
MYDVIIVGGGIAGLSAALLLGRCRRQVVVFDSDRPRNAASRALHGFLTRDGTDPREMRRLGREQLEPYETVEYRQAEVVDAACLDGGFEVVLADGTLHRSRILLLATGIVDRLPAIEGIEVCYGRSVFHCPYCDGWENRNRLLAVYGQGSEAVDFALELLAWSRDLVLCTDGGDLSGKDRMRLHRHGIGWRPDHPLRLEETDGQLERIIFADGEPLDREALFFLPEQVQHSPLAERLGCRMRDGLVETGKLQETGVPGLFLAGDAARSVKLAIIAAAEGAEAAFAIQKALQKADTG